ncbi:hypothetical protein VTH82DRAFT_2027 [Thermothelomyces myriococcoides]
MTQNADGHRRYRTRAVVNFPPFEVLDERSIWEVRRFQVHPFGSIQETCERIPYNSGKKDFFSKTGREGFEVFHYDFKVPGDDTEYTVMWDYNVGLVRMTPFFKCRGYSKTAPAKMLNMNPGLKDITYSITGGSIKAQGYWMPYSCAKAICATFCHKISGALIPLFGPQFPLECIPEKAPGHGRMVIDPEIVGRARRDTAALFRQNAALPSPRLSRSVSPLLAQGSGRVSRPYNHHHPDLDRGLPISPYTETDTDYRLAGSDHEGLCPYETPVGRLRTPTSRVPTGQAAVPTPQHSPAWTADNHPPPLPRPPRPPHPPPQAYATSHHLRTAPSRLHEELLNLSMAATANPLLSAIPGSSTPGVVGLGVGGDGGSRTNRWHPYQPRFHQSLHGNSDHLRPRASPIPTAAALPERSVILPPLQLKRRFSKVDAPITDPRGSESVDNRNVDSNINNDDNDDDTEDDATTYDVGESHAGSSRKRRVNRGSNTGSSPASGTVATAPPPPSNPASSSGKIPKPSPSSSSSSSSSSSPSTPPPPPPPLRHPAAANVQSKPGNDDENDSKDGNDGSDDGRAAGRGVQGAPLRRASQRDAAMMLVRMRRRSGGKIFPR